MNKLKNWLVLQFLPVWAKERVWKENAELKSKIEQQRQKIERMQAYIDGLEYAMRRGVTIRNEVHK